MVTVEENRLQKLPAIHHPGIIPVQDWAGGAGGQLFLFLHQSLIQ